MNNRSLNQLNSLEVYDLQLPAVPKRSALYSLDPIGIGTSMVESLTSYLIRLAYEHCVVPGVLVTTSIASLMISNVSSHEHQINIQAIWGGDYISTSMCNGMQATASNITTILKQLTGRDELHLLTMLPWAEVIAAMRLLRNKRTWCPQCYQQWRSTNQILYEPLIWSLKVVDICPQHHQPLLQQCPKCAQPSCLLTATSLPPGYCSKCGGWLGSTLSAEDTLKTLSHKELNWKCWVVKNVSELLAKTPNLTSLIPKNRIKTVLSAYVKQLTKGNINALCRLTQQPDSTLHNWLQEKSVPQLFQLLQICNSLEISLWNFLTQSIEDIPFNSIGLVTNQLKQTKQPKRRKRLNVALAQTTLLAALHEFPPPPHQEIVKRLNTERTTLRYRFPELSHAISVRYADYKKNQRFESIRYQLETIIETEFPPPSLKEVARRLKTSKDLLRRYCLALCNAISQRHATYSKMLAEQRKAELQQQVWDIALELHSKGINPTSGSVSRQMLGHSLVFKKKYFQQILQEVRRELGY
jgi:AraC-like DNA-binding protein